MRNDDLWDRVIGIHCGNLIEDEVYLDKALQNENGILDKASEWVMRHLEKQGNG